MEIKRGKYKGKKITFASSNRIDELRKVADEFMFEVFEYCAGEYLISDESTLEDFIALESGNVEPIWKCIENCYGIRDKDVSSNKLVDIISEIDNRKNLH